MKRLILTAAVLLLAATAFTQQPPLTSLSPVYTQRSLELLGLSAEEIEEIQQIQNHSADEIRRLRADLEIRKAELARLLLEDDPNMRLIERNLRATGEIEVSIRMVEIRREVAIREIVGTDRWARILQTLRARTAQTTETMSAEAERQLRELQQAMEEKQRELSRLLQNSRDAVQDEEVRQLFQELVRQSQELQQMVREKLQ